MQFSEEVNCTYFLFINSGSGGNLGTQMLEDEVQKYEFKLPIESQDDKRRVDVYIFNMRDNQSRKIGFTKLKKMNDLKEKAAAVVCGGDGTIMWVVSQFKKYDINPNLTPIAIIPLGTGNDFSRSLGWGGSPFLKWSARQLKQLIRNWMQADQAQFDLWDVTVFTYENGGFQKVSAQKDTPLQQKVLKKTFCNYFSFGIDGQIGYSFDKLRTKSKFANFAVYGAVGAFNEFQNQFQNLMTINELLESVYETPTPFDEQNYRKNGRVIFATEKNKIRLFGTQNNWEGVINEKQRNILALNIDSYTGGTTGIWSNAKGIVPGQSDFKPSYCDGMLEIVCFDSGFGIAMEKSIGGFAKKIIQSEGPLRYDFRKFEKDNLCTYLQVDGQFLKVRHPRAIIIEKSKLINNGKIKVLRRDIQKKIFNPFKDIQDLFL